MKTEEKHFIPLGAILAVFLLILLGFSWLGVKEVEASERNLRSLGTFKITWYCPCRKCSGKWDHQTSSGAYATEGRTVAVDKRVIKEGTHLLINGHEYIAEDTGGGVRGNHVDIFNESHTVCLDLEHGEKYWEVYVIDE